MSNADKSPRNPPRGRKAGPPRWFGDLGIDEFQIEFFDRILQRRPNDVLILRPLGELLARQGEYARSLEIDRRLVTLVPHDCVAHYNLACSLAMQGAPGQAIEELSRAFAYGYDDFDHLEVDPDLDNLRHLPAYQDLLRQYGLEG